MPNVRKEIILNTEVYSRLAGFISAAQLANGRAMGPDESFPRGIDMLRPDESQFRTRPVHQIRGLTTMQAG